MAVRNIWSSGTPKQPLWINDTNNHMISIVIGNLTLVAPGLSFLIPVNTLSSHHRGLPIKSLSGSGKPYPICKFMIPYK